VSWGVLAAHPQDPRCDAGASRRVRGVHGVGLIFLAEAVWFVVAGVLLGRLKKP
jgi:hypothetical protein